MDARAVGWPALGICKLVNGSKYLSCCLLWKVQDADRLTFVGSSARAGSLRFFASSDARRICAGAAAFVFSDRVRSRTGRGNFAKPAFRDRTCRPVRFTKAPEFHAFVAGSTYCTDKGLDGVRESLVRAQQTALRSRPGSRV